MRPSDHQDTASAPPTLLSPAFLRLGGLPNRPHDAFRVAITFPQHVGSGIMNFDTSPRVPIFAVPHVYLSDSAIEIAKQMAREGSVRSVVQPWQSYLPEDCLNTRLKLRLDRPV